MHHREARIGLRSLCPPFSACSQSQHWGWCPWSWVVVMLVASCLGGMVHAGGPERYCSQRVGLLDIGAQALSLPDAVAVAIPSQPETSDLGRKDRSLILAPSVPAGTFAGAALLATMLCRQTPQSWTPGHRHSDVGPLRGLLRRRRHFPFERLHCYLGVARWSIEVALVARLVVGACMCTQPPLAAAAIVYRTLVCDQASFSNVAPSREAAFASWALLRVVRPSRMARGALWRQGFGAQWPCERRRRGIWEDACGVSRVSRNGTHTDVSGHRCLQRCPCCGAPRPP